MYPRALKNQIESKFGRGKAIVLTGPRQVGKTTLIEEVLKGRDHLFLNADDPTVRALLTNANTEQLKSLIGPNLVVFIDEIQRIPNIGVTLKLITDQIKHVQLIISGSSSFEISNEISEPLTGRKWLYKMYPVWWKEIEEKDGYLKTTQQLETRMLYGSYPDILNNPGEEREVLDQLVNSYLYKDILAFGGIRRPDVLEKLVQAIALQLGSEVSFNELAQLVGVDKNTVIQYTNLLEKAFVIYRLSSFSRNLRNEIKMNQKFYFYDVGVRNSVIGNFSPLALRSDKGGLWENFLITERLKRNAYSQLGIKSYFWRTRQQQEIDYIEELNGEITGFEFKWDSNAKTRIPAIFKEAYQANVQIVHSTNFREFIV